MVRLLPAVQSSLAAGVAESCAGESSLSALRCCAWPTHSPCSRGAPHTSSRAVAHKLTQTQSLALCRLSQGQAELAKPFTVPSYTTEAVKAAGAAGLSNRTQSRRRRLGEPLLATRPGRHAQAQASAVRCNTNG